MKTHNRKSFNDLEKKGVQASKPEHYAQCQIYMLGAKIDRAIYVAVCKDDDRYYIERIKLDRQIAQKYIERGHSITSSDRIPPPISTDATWVDIGGGILSLDVMRWPRSTYFCAS